MPEQTNSSCKCPNSCGRHGNCEACRKYHLKVGTKTFCGKDGEDTSKK